MESKSLVKFFDADGNLHFGEKGEVGEHIAKLNALNGSDELGLGGEGGGDDDADLIMRDPDVAKHREDAAALERMYKAASHLQALQNPVKEALKIRL